MALSRNIFWPTFANRSGPFTVPERATGTYCICHTFQAEKENGLQKTISIIGLNCSVSGLDWIRTQGVFWIRIRNPDTESGSGFSSWGLKKVKNVK